MYLLSNMAILGSYVRFQVLDLLVLGRIYTLKVKKDH